MLGSHLASTFKIIVGVSQKRSDMRAPYTALYSFKITSWLLDEDKRKTDLVSCTLWLATTTHQTKVTSTRTSPDGKGSLTKIGSCVKAKILSPLSFDLMKQLPTYMLSLLFVDFGWSFFPSNLSYYFIVLYIIDIHVWGPSGFVCRGLDIL
jgi:hypothetical protein